MHLKPFMLALGFAATFQALPASAAERALPADQNTIDVCLSKAGESSETCIGIIYAPCIETAQGSSTMGMGECAARELAVWDAILNKSYQALLASSLGSTDAMPENRPPENRRPGVVKGSDIIRDMQRAWIAFRAKKCDVAAMQFEGGSASRVIYGDCSMRETARQALWLRAIADEMSSH